MSKLIRIEALRAGLIGAKAYTDLQVGELAEVIEGLAEEITEVKVFTVSLTASGWSSKTQYVNNSEFKADGYVYIISPDAENEDAYHGAGIKAWSVTTDGRCKFTCEEVPSETVSAIVIKIAS